MRRSRLPTDAPTVDAAKWEEAHSIAHLLNGQ
jgi:hypothetical protein